MQNQKRRHSAEFKSSVALEAIKGKFTIAELAEKYQVHPSLIHSWKKMIVSSAASIMEHGGRGIDPAEENKRDKEKQIEKLRKENEWLQKILLRLTPSERRAAVETENPQIPLLRQVKLLDINRSSIYYHKRVTASHADSHKIAN